MLQKIENLDKYLSEFDIKIYAEGIKVYPVAWSQSRPGRDDYWGVDLRLSTGEFVEPFLWYFGYLSHEKLGRLWRDSAYTSGSSEKNALERTGMIKEWGQAKKIEGEIKYNVLYNYDKYRHIEFLEKFNYISDSSLKTLSQIRHIDNLHSIYLNPPTKRCVGLTKSNSLIVDKLNIESIIELVKIDFLENLIFDVRTESDSHKYSQKEFKDFLRNSITT